MLLEVGCCRRYTVEDCLYRQIGRNIRVGDAILMWGCVRSSLWRASLFLGVTGTVEWHLPGTAESAEGAARPTESRRGRNLTLPRGIWFCPEIPGQNLYCASLPLEAHLTSLSWTSTTRLNQLPKKEPALPRSNRSKSATLGPKVRPGESNKPTCQRPIRRTQSKNTFTRFLRQLSRPSCPPLVRASAPQPQ